MHVGHPGNIVSYIGSRSGKLALLCMIFSSPPNSNGGGRVDIC